MIYGLGSATRYLAIGSVGSSFSFLIDFRSFFLFFFLIIIVDETLFFFLFFFFFFFFSQQDQISFPFFTDATPILFQGFKVDKVSRSFRMT